MKLQSLLPLVVGVIVPLITPLIPQIQQAASGNIWATAAVSAGLILWNHFVVPVNAPSQPVKKL